MKKVMQIVGNIITTMLVILVMVLAFMVVSAKASGGQPTLFGYQIMSVLSGSMEPTFQTGSVIIIEKTNTKDTFQTDDVITFKTSDDKIITHRIKEVQGSEQAISYITKGDNNNAADTEPVLAQNIIGKYENITIPKAGYLVSYATSKMGSALLLIVPGLCFIAYAAISIFSALKAIDKQRNKAI